MSNEKSKKYIFLLLISRTVQERLYFYRSNSLRSQFKKFNTILEIKKTDNIICISVYLLVIHTTAGNIVHELDLLVADSAAVVVVVAVVG